MGYRSVLAWSLGVLMPVGVAQAQSHGQFHHHGSHHGGPAVRVPGLVGGFGSWAGYGYVAGIGPGGPFYLFPPFLPFGSGGVPTVFLPPRFDSGKLLAGPLPPKGLGGLNPGPAAPKAKRNDPARAEQLVTIGDRLFRAGNTRRAADRYEQAAHADIHAAAPRVRLSQIALVRGQFGEAAHHLREAQAAQPGWLVTARDIQAIYAEPGDFAKQIAKLESHLQANPGDRDAWFVLGAEWFLSGRTRKAADVFLRLTDRKADAALAAFLDASQLAEKPR